MSQTLVENRLFATLWLKASRDAVYHAEDCTEVADLAYERITRGPTPCARDRQMDDEPSAQDVNQAPIEPHSSWVH